MHRYIPNTEADSREMLKIMGMESIEDLFQDIPNELILNRKLHIEDPMSETDIEKHFREMGKRNKDTDELICFLGAGAYDHYIPAIIKHLAKRSEFYTAYTPYQPEISQGTLQAIFEYQTMICNLTGMDVSNASLYDGATACVEGAIIATENTKRNSILVSKTLSPEVRKVIKSYMRFRNINVEEIDMAEGVTDIEKLKTAIGKDTAAVIVQNPNFFGIIEDLTDIENITHENKAMLISYVDPISLALLKNPGESGVDIAVGEGQPLGISMSYGGPYLGFMAVNSKLVRKMPGRIVGQSVDVDDKRAFVLTLQAREQHIRRYKATSNICSNQGLNALIACIYMATMGKKGLKEVAMQSTQKAHYAAKKLTESGKYKMAFNKPFFKEFALVGHKDVSLVNKELLNYGILGGYDLSEDYKNMDNTFLLCVTEKRKKAEIDKLSQVLEVL